MKLALEYAKIINCTIKYVNDSVEKWGIIYENGTGEGTLGSLVGDKADIGFGNMAKTFLNICGIIIIFSYATAHIFIIFHRYKEGIY